MVRSIPRWGKHRKFKNTGKTENEKSKRPIKIEENRNISYQVREITEITHGKHTEFDFLR